LDVLVSSTITPEAFGRSIIEAHARGVPVVATRVGGVVDIIEDGHNGLLVDPEDPKGMAEAILRLYKDKKLGETLACNARKTVEEHFTLRNMAEKTVALYENALSIKNILVIKIGSIGDCILSIPSLRAIRRAFPDAKIRLLVGIKSREVFNNCPYLDDRIVCDFQGKDKGIRGLFAVARVLVRNNCDTVVDLQNNKRSHILGFLSLAYDRYGYRNRKLGFLVNRGIVDDGTPVDPLEHQFRTLRALGIENPDRKLALFPSATDEEWARNFLEFHWVKPTHALIGINVRASPRWASKNWPLENIAKLCDLIANTLHMRVVLTGSKEDADLLEEFCALTNSKPIIAIGKTTVLQLASLIRHCRVYITPDSAPLHIASSMGVPAVGLFGPTDPGRHFVPDENSVILRKALPCGPCYSPQCRRGSECMRQIGVEEVLEAVRLLLAKKSPAAHERSVDQTTAL
jgi:ADP-heptose:LPS heptosyltransferase